MLLDKLDSKESRVMHTKLLRMGGVGLLLVKGKNKTVVEYSLAGYQNPIGVAEWKNKMVSVLPEELKSSLPSIEEIEKELEI